MVMRIQGTVIEGRKRGRTLGYPTLNLCCEGEVASGVYCGSVEFDGVTYRAAFFKDKHLPILEAHILDFSGDVYGKIVTATIGKKIRDVRVCKNDAELQALIAHDVELCSQEL